MKIYETEGVYGQGNAYVMETLEDFDEYEKYMKQRDPEFPKWNPNFYSFRDDFKKYIGKTWQDKRQLRYKYNGAPVYVEYKVIAIEDNDPMADWYWIVRNEDDHRDIKYILANSYDLRDGIKE